ncbi:hypothetical protein AB0M28_29585 [Streptomyces sp. NPDC051940]|uniref:hypothetical protein n=1 Tax=Streptomyces sp. NPDC051940 TaxID=3155675 RepID=UPI00342E1D96
MSEDPIIIKLSRDQAFVLSDWLYDVTMKSDKLSAIVGDRSVWSPLHTIAGTLDKSLAEIFMPDYGTRLEEARRRLIEVMGDDDEAGEAAPAS